MKNLAQPRGYDNKQRDIPLYFAKCRDADTRAILSVLGFSKIGRETGRAIVCIAGALVLNALNGGGWISYSRNRSHDGYALPSRYRWGGWGYGPIVSAADILSHPDYGFCENIIAPNEGPCGCQSVMRATPELLKRLAGLNFDMMPPADCIELRDLETKQAIDYRDTRAIIRMRANVLTISESTTSLSLANENGPMIAAPVMRIFNGGFDGGGRIYAIGGKWQTAPKTLRFGTTINGEYVAEADFKGLHPQMIYRARGLVLDFDPYTVDGFPRDEGKPALNAMINALTWQSAVGATADELRKIREGECPKKGRAKSKRERWSAEERALERERDAQARADATRLCKALRKLHWRIADVLHSGAGRKLQRQDSDMAERILLRTIRSGGSILGFHDGFLVPENDVQTLAETMERVSSEVFGTALPVAINRRTISQENKGLS